MSSITVTRKLKLRVVAPTPEKKNQDWVKLRLFQNQVWRAANQAYSDLMLFDRLKERCAVYDQEKLLRIAELIEAEQDENKRKRLSKERNSIYKDGNNSAQKELKDIFGVGLPQLAWRNVRDNFGFPSTITDALMTAVNKDFKNDYIEIKQGNRSVRNYRKGFPIPFRGRGTRFWTENVVKESNKKKYFFRWNGITFEVLFGKDVASRRSEIDKILDSELPDWKYGDSKLQIDGKKIFLLLSLQHPKSKMLLDSSKILYVDAGIEIPVKCKVDNFKQTFGQAEDLIRFRMQIQSRRRELAQKLRHGAKGGHGRKRKMKSFDDLGSIENKFIQTYNHKLSKSVVEMALNNNCGVIDLTQFGVSEAQKRDEKAKKSTEFMARNWAGFDLTEKIKYKASVQNIEVIVHKKELVF